MREHTDKIIVWDKPHRQTFGEAKNAGANIARGEFLVFIDADVIIPEPEKFFEELLAAFKKNKKLWCRTTSHYRAGFRTSIVVCLAKLEHQFWTRHQNIFSHPLELSTIWIKLFDKTYVK